MTYHSAVADLERLDDVQQGLGGLARHEESVARGVRVSDVPCEIDGRERGGEVGEHACESDREGFAGDVAESKGLFDHGLRGRWLVSPETWRSERGDIESGETDHVVLDARQHVGVIRLDFIIPIVLLSSLF